MTGFDTARSSGAPTGVPTGAAIGSLLGADWAAWWRFVAVVNAAGGRITKDSGNPYDYATVFGSFTSNATVLAALAAYNEAVSALRAAQGQPDSGGSYAAAQLGWAGAAGETGAGRGFALPPLQDQTDDVLGMTRGLTLADQLTPEQQPFAGVPKPLRKQLATKEA